MFIQEFQVKFISKKERSRLFDTLRRLSRLETRALHLDDEDYGWPSWPQSVCEDPRMQKA